MLTSCRLRLLTWATPAGWWVQIYLSTYYFIRIFWWRTWFISGTMKDLCAVTLTCALICSIWPLSLSSLLLAAQTFHRWHPDAAVSFSWGADRSWLQYTSWHLEHSLHGTTHKHCYKHFKCVFICFSFQTSSSLLILTLYYFLQNMISHYVSMHVPIGY